MSFIAALAPILVQSFVPAPALNDALRGDIRCVAVLAVVAYQQRSGGWVALPRIDARAQNYAAIVGARVMDAARAERGQVAQLFENEARRLAATPAREPEARQCLTRMEVELAAAPLPRPTPRR